MKEQIKKQCLIKLEEKRIELSQKNIQASEAQAAGYLKGLKPRP